MTIHGPPKLIATNRNEELELEYDRKVWVVVGNLYDTKALDVNSYEYQCSQNQFRNHIFFSIPQMLELGTDVFQPKIKTDNQQNQWLICLSHKTHTKLGLLVLLQRGHDK